MRTMFGAWGPVGSHRRGRDTLADRPLWESQPGPGYPAAARRGGREAEGAGLLNLCTGNCTEGSNPSLSASKRPKGARSEAKPSEVHKVDGRLEPERWPSG